MKSHLLALASAAALPALAGAQEVVVPEGFANSYTGNTTLLWRSTAFRFQCLYDTTHFINQGLNHPITINRLRFRGLNGIVDPGGQVYTGVTVQLSSSPSDYDTMSTTFATNVGADVVTAYTGDVTLLPMSGGAPNDNYIDIVLTTPFQYNPELGMDLCVDVTAPTAPSATVPNTAAASNRTLHRARRNSTNVPGNATGGLSDFAAAMRIDYTVPPGVARDIRYGVGCYDNHVSFYETFLPGVFDLAGSPGVVNSILLTPNTGGGYTVTPGSNAWFTPTSANLGLGDDALSAPQPLAFTFSYPGGSTNALIIESNGNVWLGTPTHTSFVAATDPASLLSRGPVISALYSDFDPSATGFGTVHFDEDIANGVAYVTWLGLPNWIATPPPVRGTNTVQAAIYSTGQIELRYQEVDTSLSWTSTIVGFSPGANNRDPGNRDISATMPFSTATDLVGLTLAADTRPVLGRTVNLETSAIPANSLLTVTLLSFSKFDPGLPLAAIGMPGCFQYAGLDVNQGLGFTNPTSSVPFVLPNNMLFAGIALRSQSAAFVPGVNALGALSSNGLELQINSL